MRKPLNPAHAFAIRAAFALGILLGMTAPAGARPISYPGGWTFMTMNDGDRNMLHLTYTLSPRFSAGYAGEYARDGQYYTHMAAFNALLQRWNGIDSQANLYLKGGAGIAYSDAGPRQNATQPAFQSGIAADWENRRFFVSYENEYKTAGDIGGGYSQRARVGLAPYIGEYGDLHTWLMTEVRHTPQARHAVTVTPMVRLFKGDHLVEAGMNNRGEPLLNWTIRF